MISPGGAGSRRAPMSARRLLARSRSPAVYFHVPVEVQETFLRELRRLRLRPSVLRFRELLLLFCAAAAGLVLLKGDSWLGLPRRLFGDNLSDQALRLLMIGTVVLCVAGALVYLLRQIYRKCGIQHHRFCAPCNAVDSDDKGYCPVCRMVLSEEGGFFFTSYSNEKQQIERYGLLPSKEA